MIERLDDYIDIPAIERQTKIALENLEQLIAAFERLQKKAAETSRTIRPQGIQGNKKENGFVAQKNYDRSSEGLDEEIKLQKEFEAGQKRLNALKQKAAFLASEQAAEEAKLREQNKQAKREVELSVKADLVKVGSLDSMKVALAQLTSEYNSLEKAERDAESGKGLQTKIADLAKEIKEAEFALGNFRSNVGNYPDTSREMNALISQMEELKNAGKAGSTEFNQMSDKLEELLLSTQGLTTGEKSLKLELRENIALLARMKRAGLDNTEAYQGLVKETGELEDAIADTREEVKRYASDTQTLDQAIGIFKGIGAAAQVAEGASALLGAENEDLTKSIQKMVAIQTVLSGAQEIGNALQKESTFMLGLASIKTNVLSVSQKLYTMVVGTSTGALKAFKLALAGTGIGLIIIALGYLISNWGEVTEALSGYTRAQKLQNAVQKSAIDSASGEIAKLEILRKQLNSSKVGTEERNKALRDYNVIADTGNQLNEKSAISNEKVNQAIDRQRKLIIQRAEAKAYEEKISEKLKERMNLELDLANSEEKRGKIEEDLRKKGQKGMMQLFDRFNIDKPKKEIAKIDKDLNTLIDKDYSVSIDIRLKESIKERIDQAKEVAKAEANNIQNSKEKAVKLRRIQYQEEYDAAKGNAELQQQLAITYNSDISDITREYSQKTASAERDTAESLTQIRLSMLKDGVEKEKSILINEATSKTKSLQDRLKYDTELTVKSRQNITETIKAIDEKLNQDIQKLDEQEVQNRKKIENDILIIHSESVRAIAEDETKTLEERIIAYANYQQMREDAIVNQAEIDINAAKGNASEIKKIEAQKSADLIDLQKSTSKSVEDATKAEYAKTEKLALDRINALSSAENMALNDRYKDGLIDKEEYEKQKLAITNKYTKLEIEAQLKAIGMQLLNSKLSLEERASLLAEFGKLSQQSSDIDIDNSQKAKEKQEDLDKQIKQMRVELAKQTVSSIVEIYNESQNKRLTQIDEQKSANEEAMNKELEQAGNNETLKNQIKEKYALRDKKLDKERRKIEHDKAVAAKATALFEIAMSTAVAIASQMKGLPLTLPLIIMIGAMGAVQAAAVASREVPKYAKGRQDGPAEIAWVGEEGPEIIREQSGKAYWTPGKPTLTYLPARAEVIPHDEIESRLLIQEAFEGRALTPAERMQLVKLSGGDQARMISEAFYDIESYDHSSASQLDEVELMSFIEKAKQTINSERLNTKSFSWEQKGFRISDIIPALPNHNLINKVNNTQSQNINLRTLEARIDNLTEVVRNKRENHFTMSNGEWHKMVKNGNNWTEYLDQYFE